ncbi:CHAT domain-containing protein [Streptomyces neyagawaensis]|uniref:CHAT domain-containing protein n=1 Tax=Streptomyces neyagawaensis TaxID=42238 RepID=A0ABV3AXL8_9ACTN
MATADGATAWSSYLAEVLTRPDQAQRSAGLAAVCLAGDTALREFSRNGSATALPTGRPSAHEVREAAKELWALTEHPGNHVEEYQRVVALVFTTWRPQFLVGAADPMAEITSRTGQCARALESARPLGDDLLTAWVLLHHGRGLRQAHAWHEALAAYQEATSLAGDLAGEGPGPLLAAPGTSTESPAVLRAVLGCRAFKDIGQVAASIGDLGLWHSAVNQMVSLAEGLVPVRPSLLAEALSKQGELARHIGDRDTFRQVEDRLRSWAEQSGLNRVRRAWLAQAAYNAEHLHDHSRAYRLLLERIDTTLDGHGLPATPLTPAAVAGVLPELQRQGLQARRIALGNTAYDCAIQLWKAGRTKSTAEDWAEAQGWLDVAEAAYRNDGHNGLAAVRLSRARLLAHHPTAPDPAGSVDQALAAGESGVRSGLLVNAVVAAAEWCAPGDRRVADRLSELLARATPRYRGVLLYGRALWYERMARAGEQSDNRPAGDIVTRWYAEAESAALEAGAALEVGGVLVDMTKSARVWEIAARVCGATGRTPPDDVPETTLRRLLNAVRCVAELFITVSDLDERRDLGREHGPVFRQAADLAVRLADPVAADMVMEAVRRDRVGLLISDLSQDPAVTDIVRRAAEQVIAANAAFPAVPETDMRPSDQDETRTLSRSAEAIAATRARSAEQADLILGVLGSLTTGRALPHITARSVLELCPRNGVSAVLQLLSSHVSALGADDEPRTLYRRLTWRDEAGEVHEHFDAVPLPFDPTDLTPERNRYWQTLPRLTSVLLPEPLLGLLRSSGPEDPMRLMILPTGLFDIAFDTLPLDAERQLLDVAVLSVHASLTTMTHLLARATLPTVQPAIAVYDLLRLAHAEQEFRSLESHLSPLFEITGRAMFMDTLGSQDGPPGYRMLALAVHGTDDAVGGWGQTKILPDGNRLTAAEAMALSFPQLCVLASCHSSIRLRGGVELAGFPLALFARGATTVIGSLHEIDDEATSEIMQAFWQELGRGTDPVRALRQAKLRWLRGDLNRRYTPRLWGGLVALGGAQF